MDIISNIALISINETLLVQLISFLIFLFIIDRIMFRPINETIRDRYAYIDKKQAALVDAEKALNDLQRRIRESELAVKKESFESSRALEEAGTREAGSIMAVAREEISVMKKENEAKVKVLLDDARQHLNEESRILAQTIMGKVLNRNL
jgi:F-type H+-transporting ATPase subunit b